MGVHLNRETGGGLPLLYWWFWSCVPLSSLPSSLSPQVCPSVCLFVWIDLINLEFWYEFYRYIKERVRDEWVKQCRQRIWVLRLFLRYIISPFIYTAFFMSKASWKVWYTCRLIVFVISWALWEAKHGRSKVWESSTTSWRWRNLIWTIGVLSKQKNIMLNFSLMLLKWHL